MNSTKLAGLSVGLLLAIFCTIGMSFRPVYDEGEAAEIVMSGQKRAHWDNKSTDSCTGAVTHRYNSTVDKANTNVQTRGNGSVTISTTETANVTSPASGSPRTVTSGTAAGNTATISWNSGLATESNASSPTYTNDVITVAHKKAFTISATPSDPDEYYFAGWGTTTAESSIDNYDNPRDIVSDMKITGYTEGSKGNPDYSSTAYSETYYAFFKPRVAVTITLEPNANGTISYSYKNVPTTTISAETTFTTKYDVTLTATPADGYKFFGWYTLSGSTENYISYANPSTRAYKENATIYAKFIPTNQAIFNIKGTEQYYYDLNRACSEAASSTSKIVYPINDGVVPAGNCTIPANVTLLIPYNSGNNTQTEPAIVRSESLLTPFRTLTLLEGANIVCNSSGAICLGGQIMSAGGGKPTGYTTGPCGVIDMSRGGHIELNSGSTLYAWGFVKGQDMDQGNNTANVGTITANSGATVWENLAFGDWRGGSACLNINGTRFFPFQSYFPQNIEVPLRIKNGASDNCYSVVYANSSNYPVSATMIGSSSALFKTSTGGEVRKWYDPTTDLICYELSGTANLDAITVSGLPMIGSISSSSFDLPISSNMHIILTNSSVTLSKPMVMQPGAKIEIKNDANITLDNNLYMYDKDDWGLYVVSRYFRNYGNTYGILTIHKYRGDGTSKDLLDDAQLIVDGTLTIGSSGRLYATAGGADIMGNDGGRIIFPGTLAGSSALDAVTGNGDKDGQVVEDAVAVNTANLHNENESYTQVKANKTFLNINGRWFNQTDGAAAEKANHTYDFTYISSGAVNSTSGTNTTTDAVYSWDKTGLELRQKWANVTADACANWWHGQGDQSTWFYNWTLNSAWHQFIPTATEGLYSGSNNTLYTKSDCDWEPFGDADVNCLYEIGGVKKALVEGQFVALEANNNDPAYHAADDANQYYICFEGCNWHAADKYTEEQKAYIIAPDTFIWYNSAWMSVNFQEPFAYTLDATNVPVYYEYTDGEWTLAEPYVRVVDGLEDRPFWFFKDAFKFANSVLRTSPTITILRDISARTADMSYTAANKTCTLDLNGNKLTLTVVGAGTSAIKMFNINAAGTTFTITDSSEGANGEFRLIAAPNTTTQTKRWYGVYLTNGTLVLNAGKIYAEDNFAYTSTSNTGIVSGVGVAAGMSFTMNDGTIEAYSKYAAYGVDIAGSTSANATVKIKGGTIHAETTQVTTAYGMIVAGGTTTITGGKIEARAKTTTAIGVAVTANANGYYGTLKVEGGEIDALTTTTTCYGVQVGEAVVYSSGNTISDRVKSKATISGGTIRATSTKTESSSLTIGVRSFGTTEITGGTIEAIGTQSYAYSVYAVSGTTTISGTPTIIARAPTIACGACAGLTPASKTGVPYNGNLVISGGRFEVSATTSTTAYGVLVQALGRAVNYSTTSGYYPGNYVSAGSATISGGEFDVQAHTTTAYGIFVKGAITQSGAKLDADGNLANPVTSAPPTCTVSGGKFKVSGTGTVLATNNAADAANYHITGGYYSHNDNLANYTATPKHVLTLPADDANRPPYYYKVADAYQVIFKNGETELQSTYQESGKAPVYDGETPTKASTASESYIFDGWSTTDGGSVVSPLPNVTSDGATYYAHYETTTLKYIVTLDATTNGGSCETDKIYVEPSTAVGTLPTATKTGYTFNGWYTAASGGAKLESTTTITADATYYAQFTINNYTLTWVLDGGKVGTAGKYGTTAWPAKNATGTQSEAVPYASTLTAPVVARTGYTFSRWEPLVASTMPAEAATYTAIWTPKTNTAYTVKHYLQNVDGTYPAEPFETEASTGTTATSVTPDVKSYEGFISPATQTKTIAADGSMVVEYQYARRHYTFTLDAATNGGTTDVPSIDVIHGATIGAVPPDAQKGCNDFTGWYTKAVGGVKITSDFVIEYDMKTLYAQFSDETRTWPITYLPGANGSGTVTAGTKTCGETATLSSNTFTRDGYEQTGWSTTDGGTNAYELDGEYTANAAITLYPFWTLVGYQINFVDEDGTTTLGDYPKTLNPGATVTAPAEPTKAQTAEYTYTFAGWSDGVNTYASDAIPAVSAAVTYRATYNAVANVASVKVGSADPTYYTTIQDAFTVANSAESASTIKMLKDVSGVAASLVYSGTQNCTLDLNNHTIAGTVTKLIDVNASGKTFTIDDSSDDKGGMISLSRSTNGRIYSLYITAGIVKLTHGKIYCKNTSTGSSAGATAIYVTAGQTFTMDDGTVESESQISSYAIYAPAGTSTITINDGLVKGHTNTGATAGGIICYAKGLTINGGRIIGHAWTNTSYGLYLYGGSATLKGGVIEATNDTISNNGTTTAYGIYVRYSSSTYKGVLTIPSTSTVEVLAKARTSTAYAVVVSASSSGSKIQGGTFTAIAKTSTTAQGINSAGTITVSGGTFNVYAATTTSTITTWPCGIYNTRGTVTVSGNSTFNVTSGASRAYGVFAYGTVGKNGKSKYSGTIKINGGTFNVTTTTTTAYGAYAGLFNRTVNLVIPENATDTIAGTHYMPGIISITGGTFNVKATTNTAYGIVVAAQKSETIGDVTTDRIPTVTVTGGKFKVTGTSKTYAVNTSATNTALDIQAGWYNINTNLANYTAPTKSCNYWVLPLTGEDPYKYEVAEACKVTWDATTNGGSCATDYTIVKKGATIGTAVDPLPEATKENYSFDGWYTTYTGGGNQVTTSSVINAAMFAYARFTPNTYTITYKDQGNVDFSGSNLASLPNTHTYGTATALVDGTKAGYTFDGWFTTPECTGEPITSLGATAYTANITLYAKWTSDETGDRLDIVDAQSGKLVINMTTLRAAGWPYEVNDVKYKRKESDEGTMCADDRTITITHDAAVGSQLSITVKDNTSAIVSKHSYIVPKVYESGGTLSGTDANSVVFVRGGKLTAGTASAHKIIVSDVAELEVTGALVVDTLILRTKSQSAAVLTLNGGTVTGQVIYSRVVADNSGYHQFGIPLTTTCNVNAVKLSDGTTPTYGTAWVLNAYNEAARANNGSMDRGQNWTMLSASSPVQGGMGYEMFSGSKYYREFYFPVSLSSIVANPAVPVSYTADGEAGQANIGWNILCSPLVGRYEVESTDPATGIKLSWFDETEQAYTQEPAGTILPARPFSYQALSDGSELVFRDDQKLVYHAPRRRAAAADATETEWIRLDVKDANNIGDQTSLFVHPSRFANEYKNGVDVVKLSETAPRAMIYSVQEYGNMAFAGVSDALLEQGVALTVYSPKAQELTISMRENAWLNRMAYVWLFDSETGTYTDLLDSDATIEVNAGTTANRFYIIGRFFAPQITTDLEPTSDSSQKGREVEKLLIHDKLYIRINGVLYDATGKTVNLK